METQFKDLLLETLRAVKDHPDAQGGGVGFVTHFDEEPDWEVIISFAPKHMGRDEAIENLH